MRRHDYSLIFGNQIDIEDKLTFSSLQMFQIIWKAQAKEICDKSQRASQNHSFCEIKRQGLTLELLMVKTRAFMVASVNRRCTDVPAFPLAFFFWIALKASLTLFTQKLVGKKENKSRRKKSQKKTGVGHKQEAISYEGWKFAVEKNINVKTTAIGSATQLSYIDSI